MELGGVKPNPRSGLVYEGIALCKKEGVDFILAVGGGSTIDSSKAIAAGSEGSANSVITNENGMLKRGASGDAIRPKSSIQPVQKLTSHAII